MNLNWLETVLLGIIDLCQYSKMQVVKKIEEILIK